MALGNIGGAISLGRGRSEPAPAFPLSVSANGRYLVSPNGTPFRLQSELAFLLSTMATASDIITYLDNRKARGFNAFELLAIASDLSGGTAPFNWHRQNRNGDEPFTSVGDLSTPNPAYWTFIDYIIDQAALRGMAVLLYGLYSGYNGDQGQGWWEVVAANPEANCQFYGDFLGKRYKYKHNVIWMFGGDYTQPDDSTRAKNVAFVNALRAAGAMQIAGAEWGGPDSLVTDQAGYTYGTNPLTSHMQLDSFYGQGPSETGYTFDTADRSWVRTSPVIPSFAKETMLGNGTYVAGLASDRPALRKYHNWAALAGSVAGINMGEIDIATAADLSKLNLPFFDDYQYHCALFQSVPWYRMKPSGTASVSPHGSSGSSSYCGRVLIVSGGGSGGSLITSCLSDDGNFLLAYVPSTGTGTTTFSVDCRSLSAGSKPARWYNLTTSIFQHASPAAVDNSLSAQSFTTPGNNGTGTNDWMLVIG
jgi:hypothetical protein